MTKLHFVIVILGSLILFWDISYALGWLLGWLFIGIFRHYRTQILDYVIDIENFKISLFIAYLLGIIVWLSIPLGLSLLLPKYINPIAIFGAYFADRILLFIINAVKKGE